MTAAYDDDYGTCDSTYVTLRLYSETIDASEITRRVGLQPTSTHVMGEIRNPHGRRPLPFKHHGWFLSSEGAFRSRDLRRHLDWLLDAVSPASERFRQLAGDGVRMDISCFWVSRSGHGGPILSSAQLARLGVLGIDVWFDFYASSEEEPSGIPT